MATLAEAERADEGRREISSREEAANAILPLLSEEEPQTGAALSRALLANEGKRGGARIHSANVIREGLNVLEARRLAQRIPRRGWVRFTQDVEPEQPRFVDFDYEWATLKITDLFVDEYQRPLTSFVAQIVSDFQPHLFQTLLVSDRGPKSKPRYAVIDGQTRWQAAMRLGLAVPVPCLVYKGLSPQDEAAMFASIQKNRRGMTSVDRFRAEVFAQDPAALELKEAVERCGYVIGDGTGEIKGVAALEVCYRREPFLLERTLLDIKDAWPDVTPDAGLIRGMHLFFRDYPIGEERKKVVEDEKLVRRLKVAGRQGIEERARAARQLLGKGAGSERYYGMAIQNAYESRARA